MSFRLWLLCVRSTLLLYPPTLSTPIVVLNSFERGRKDSFDVKGMDIGEMTSVVIRHDNKGRVAAWHLGQVEVVHPFNHKIYFFPCNEWLQKTKEEGMDGCKRTLVPGQGGPGGGRQFKVAVHTSDIKGAGTPPMGL